MYCKPRLLLHRAGRRPKVSVLLIDWGVRESFHALHYLTRQTAPRDDYEVIWLEFYDRRPEELARMAAGGAALDKWVVLGYSDDLLYHKHRLYNVGLLAAEGEVCVICDSDAIFLPSFIEALIGAFEHKPDGVVHLDQVRNDDPRFHPFNYPALQDVLGEGCINWHEWTTRGLIVEQDRLHRANYGACMAARRKHLLAVGGADEHLDYLGYVCGPYELTFRLENDGRPHRWLRDHYLYHVWHPNQSGQNHDYQGPHDGRYMSLRALDARASFRVKPHLPNPWVAAHRRWRPADLPRLLEAVARRPEPTWRADSVPQGLPDDVYWVERDLFGFNVFSHAGDWFALPYDEGPLDPARARRGGYPLLLRAATGEDIEAEVTRRYGGAPLPNPSGPLGRMMRRFRAQPIEQLPGRVWRKTRKLLAGVRRPAAPW